MAFVPTRIPNASAPGISQFKIEAFKGADLTDAAANVDSGRSPFCPNMIRESRGKVRKRTGYYIEKQYPDRINGVHFFADGGQSVRVVHAGAKLYVGDTVLADDMNDARSSARQLGDKLCIMDGKKYRVLQKSGNSYVATAPAAYIPTILVSRNPDGGGTVLEPINMLGSGRKESFLGKESVTNYQLSASGLDSTAVTAEVMQSNGSFKTLTEGNGITVNRTTGVVSFSTAPGVSPVTGEDNVVITYHKTIADYADKINRCRVMTAYGVNGARDRLFVAGDPQFPNRDYYSQLGDPTYFGDKWYSVLGQSNAAIMGYSIVNDQLAAHKDHEDDDTNIFLRRGTLIDGEAAFPLSGSCQGSGAVSRWAFGVLETEPLFVTDGDIMAVTPSDVLGERYAQGRGYYLRGVLAEKDLSDACAVVHDRFYVLSTGSELYLLDGAQAVYERNSPYATRQYEAYYWTDIAARVLFDDDGILCFGREDGALCCFHAEYDSIASFNDEGREIYAAWKTPEFFGKNFYYRKDFQKIAVLLGAAAATGCRIWAFYDGTKELLRDYDGTARYFSYSNISYSAFSYSTDTMPKEICEKIKIKKVKKVQFLFENGKLNEPFALYEAAAEFVESR